MDVKSNSMDVAKGMASWDGSEDDRVQNYTCWQVDLMRPYLGRKILEIGAGGGRLTKVLTVQQQFDRYAVVEPSQHFHNILKNAFPDMELYSEPIEQMDTKLHKSFDTLVLIHVLEHIEFDVDFLQKTAQFLQPESRLIIMVPAFNWLMSDLDRNVGHFRRYNKRRMRDIAARLNMDIVINRYDNFIGLWGWWWVCKVQKIHYQTAKKKSALVKYFSFFDRYILPIFSAVEKVIPPPVGLNLTTVLKMRL